MEYIGCIYVIQGKGLESNTYIVKDKVPGIIDPGMKSERFLKERLDEVNLELDDIKVVVNTHAHVDHCAADFLFPKAKVYAHDPDATAIEYGDPAFTCASLLKGKLKKRRVEKLRGGQVLDFGLTKLRVIHTPGHTAGSVCLYDEKHKTLISGDLVFAEGVGRTDLPSGDADDLRRSLEKLASMDIVHLLPGHGPLGNKESIKEGLKFSKIV